jgi:hypothetical protein
MPPAFRWSSRQVPISTSKVQAMEETPPTLEYAGPKERPEYSLRRMVWGAVVGFAFFVLASLISDALPFGTLRDLCFWALLSPAVAFQDRIAQHFLASAGGMLSLAIFWAWWPCGGLLISHPRRHRFALLTVAALHGVAMWISFCAL